MRWYKNPESARNGDVATAKSQDSEKDMLSKNRLINNSNPGKEGGEEGRGGKGKEKKRVSS